MGYISKEMFETLFVDDIHLVTKLKKNIKNSLMNLHDKILLRKRGSSANLLDVHLQRAEVAV